MGSQLQHIFKVQQSLVKKDRFTESWAS